MNRFGMTVGLIHVAALVAALAASVARAAGLG
jgi:hypothetical protein